MKEQWLAKTSKHKGYLSDWAARSHSSTCIKDMRDYQCHFETLINFISNTHKKNYKKNIKLSSAQQSLSFKLQKKVNMSLYKNSNPGASFYDSP